jgi:hypothetical protein
MDEMGVGWLRGLFQFQCVSARFRRFWLFTLLLGILVHGVRHVYVHTTAPARPGVTEPSRIEWEHCMSRSTLARL